MYTVTQFAHAQINNAMQAFKLSQAVPIDWTTIFNKLTSVASDLAAYFEKAEGSDNGELIQILGRLSEITYTVLGNGSYLYEKGIIKL